MKSNRWFKIINCDETIFDCIDTFHAYFLGLVAADGNIPQSKKFLTITQSHEVGYKLLKQLATYLNHSGNLYYQEKSDAYTIYINSTKIVEFVEKYNIAPRKSLTFEYPSELPPHLFPYFIRGYFDGDGSLGYYKTNTSRIFVMSVVGTEMFIKSCNELFPIKGAIRNLKKKNSWELRWSGKKALKIYEFIYVKTKDLVIDSSKQKKYNLLAETMHQPRNDKFSKIKDELIKMHMAGLPVAHISKVLGSPFQVIYKWMKRIGLKPHTSKEHVSNSTVSS